MGEFPANFMDEVYCASSNLIKYMYVINVCLCSLYCLYYRRADCLPSSLNSKAEERKYVSNVQKANGHTKTPLHNYQKPVTTSSTPDEREPATGFAVIPYIQGVMEPIKRILNSH